MADSDWNSSVDRAFDVAQVHRLRFTRDVLGADVQVLLDLLEPSGAGPPRVQFWLDEQVAWAQADLLERLAAICAAHGDRLEVVGPIQQVVGGEAIKNDIHVLERMLKVMHAAQLDRRSYVVVIGGGAVLDAVGFAAAIAHRGIRLVRLPTTTLAQADSGVGVKNGVNLFGKKNWIGSFAVPWGVINDAALLTSLSDRDFLCGFAEAVKVGLLKRRTLFEQIERAATAIRGRDLRAAWPILRESAQLHLNHITRGGDPFETQLARPLDFGHWSAHRLEAMSDFRLRHGEAVALGVAIDTIYSSLACGCDGEVARRVLACLGRLGLIVFDSALEQTAALFEGLEEFRQHLGGCLTLTMLQHCGRSFEVHEVDELKMVAAIEQVVRFARQHGSAPLDATPHRLGADSLQLQGPDPV